MKVSNSIDKFFYPTGAPQREAIPLISFIFPIFFFFSLFNISIYTDTLSDTELQATLFAPSNEAFERLARDTGTTVEGILNAPADLLTDLLEYHVIPGPGIEASQLKTGLRFNTLNGDPVLVESQKIKPEPKYAGCASLDIHMDTYIDEDPEPLICDIKACNALVHIVDYPLIPNNAQIRTLLPEGKFKTQLSG